MMKHQVFVFDGDGVGLGEALVALVVGVAEAELEAGAVVDAAAVDFAAVAVADFDADAEALADPLLLAVTTGTCIMDVAPMECPADADMVTVRPAEPGELVESAALPVGPFAPPPPAVPKSRNAPTAMPAKPPVSIRPTPLRRSERRSARAWRRSSASSSSAPPRPAAAACEPPRAGSSARLACEALRPAGSSAAARPLPCEPPRAALPLSAAFAAARASTRDIRGSAAAAAPMTRVLSE
jgi:hypothetical protein